MRKPKILAPPRTIFLQAGEIEEDARFSELAEDDNVTWCMDKQFDTDVEYRLVRPSRHKRRAGPAPPTVSGEVSK